MRFFNTAGPVRSDLHYCLPPLTRWAMDDILGLIAQQKYFVLHAPRQTGKTSSLLALMDYLNREGMYRCLYCNVEMGQSARENVKRGMKAILSDLISNAQIFLADAFPGTIWQEALATQGEDAVLYHVLSQWAQHSPKPLVLFFDEIDALIGDTLISVLRQLRTGYAKRPAAFPQSIILCGVRDVRDYRIHSDKEKTIITGGSAFNVKARSLRLDNFTSDDIHILYQQHTAETGQIFTPDALDLAWELTQGQPWLVNALAYEACFEMDTGRDRARPITPEYLHEAKERLIERRETHLDQLADKLQEDRVRQVLEPILTGTSRPEKLAEDDVQYVADLGLITMRGQLRIANPIYREVIPRVLTYTTQLTISHEPVWYLRTEDGRMDMEKLLAAFQQFFREHSEHWVERFDYKEAGPQLLLQAFLQRIVNGGGRIEREYGLGRNRTDLLLIWPYGNGQWQRVVLELKILYGSLTATIAEGLEQTWQYMDRCGTAEGHLLIFDRTPDMPWDAKIFQRAETYRNHAIQVWGM